MRALLLARKSNKVRLNDEKRGDGLSLETQDEATRVFAEAQGWDIVDTAGDTVSGRKVKPSKRRNLGPWLTDPALIGRWDVLVAAKADRISREHIEYWAELEAWAVANGKTLVVVERGGVFFPNRHEGDVHNWAGLKDLAGKEYDVIRARIIESQCRIMRDGFWVGRAPFGYQIQGDKYHKTLTPAATADYVRAIFERSIAGDSLRAIAAWLTSEGVQTERRNSAWNEGVVKQILGNETYTGQHTRGCAHCGGSHRLAVPELVDMATQARAVAAMRARRRGYSGGGRPTDAPAMLTPTCDSCGIAMYRGGTGTTKAYYCKTRTTHGKRVGCKQAVNVAWLDREVDEWMSALQRPEETSTTTYPAAALESKLEGVRRDQRSAFESRDMSEVARLESVICDLESELETTERERVVSVPTGRLLGEAWRELQPGEHRAWLRTHGITVRVAPEYTFPDGSPAGGRLSIDFA